MEPDAVSLTACVHCGLCLPACPTFRILGDENDSPRGRLYLMKASYENRLTSSTALRLHLGRCLDCRACETACPADVPYGRLLEETRVELARSRPLHRAGSRVFLWLLTGSISRPLYGVLRAVRDAGLAGRAGRVLPGRVGRAARVLAASAPQPFPHPGRASGASAALETTVPPGSVPPSDLPHVRHPSAPAGPVWALFDGCVTRGLFGHLQDATRRFVGALGWREASLPGRLCCGALHAHAGHLEDARRLARRTIDACETSGADRIVCGAAGCSAAMKQYERLLAHDSAWGDRARRFAEGVRDVSELLAEAETGAGSAERAPSGRIAYDAPCHLLHAQGIDRTPVQALGRIGAAVGFSVEPLPSSEECCGGAGTYGLRLPELSQRIVDGKLDEIQAGGYDAVVTGNPGCIMQIAAGLRERGDLTPVLHPVELTRVAASVRAARH